MATDRPGTAASSGLRVDGVTIDVPDGRGVLTILDDVTLSVERREIVSLVGPSGSGKSTLLAVAALLRRPDRGDVTVDGVGTARLSRRELTRLRARSIGVVFQSPNLFPSLTALEQLELVAHMAGRLDGAARARASELLGAVGLGDRMDNRPAQLSGGERQRVGLARALMNSPALLLADEPTSALDEQRGREVMELLVEEATRSEAATLVVTHTPAELPQASRSLRLEAGRLVDAPAGGAHTAATV